jgi:hypothetical protein
MYNDEEEYIIFSILTDRSMPWKDLLIGILDLFMNYGLPYSHLEHVSFGYEGLA